MDHTQVYQNLDSLVRQKLRQNLFFNWRSHPDIQLYDGRKFVHPSFILNINLNLWPVESQLGKAVGLHTGYLESRL